MHSFTNRVHRFFRKSEKQVGLVVEEGVLRFVVVRREKILTKIIHHGTLEIPDGTMKEGRIYNMEAFIVLLKRLKEETGKAKVIVGVSPEIVRAHSLYIPIDRTYSKEELTEHIQREVSAYITHETNIHINDSVVEYYPYHISPKTLQISMLIFHKGAKREYEVALKKAGFEGEITSGLSLYGRYAPYFNETTRLVLHLGHKSLSGAIIREGQIIKEVYSKGGLNEILHTIEKNQGISREFAQKMLSRNGIESKMYPRGLQDEIRIALRDILNEAHRDIIKWNYPKYRSMHNKEAIQDIILLGEGSNIKGVAKNITDVTGCRVYKGSFTGLENKKIGVPSIHANHAPLFDVAYSLALSQ
jgi:Tfp pilus assembly PilM family ATPase